MWREDSVAPWAGGGGGCRGCVCGVRIVWHLGQEEAEDVEGVYVA